MANKKYKWGTIVPLIGGMTLAGKRETGEDPDFLLTYKAFADNEKNIRAYMPDVPYEVLDDGGNMDAGKGADFISALCPCAGLSTLGTGDASKREAANSWMYKTTEHVLGHLKPKVFWGENAPAMYSQSGTKGEAVRQRLQAMAEQHGYTMSYYFTSTHLHGVPQRRHRTFYFFWQGDKVPELRYFNRPTPNWKDYLAQVPANASMHQEDMDRAYRTLRATRFAKWADAALGEGFPDVIRARMRELNKNMMTVQDYVLDDPAATNRIDEMRAWYESENDQASVKYIERIMGKIADGKGIWDDSPSIFLPETNFNALIGRTTDAAHPVEHRSLTVRECMHLMALPHDFELVTKTVNHICQNVPVCTGGDLQHEVLAYLNGELPLIDAKVVFQNNFKQTIDHIDGGSSKLLVF
jgi:site-specific DNA-cytosine methylase